MASLGGGGEGGNGSRDELKSQFTTREGTYRLVSAVDFSRTTRPVTYMTNNTAPATGTSPPVRLSFVTIPSDPAMLTGSDNSLSSLNNTSATTNNTNNQDPLNPASPSSPEDPNPDLLATNHRFCFNIGKELLVYPFMGVRKVVDVNKPMDKRGYKGTNPTCHDFNSVAASHQNLPLLIGFSGGQIQYVDSIFKEINKLYNEERVIDKTRVTCIRWLPNSTTLFLVSHASGHLYLYNVDTSCGTTAPHYQMTKHGLGYTVWNCKSKTPRNPITRWTIGEGAINEFDFSPCGQYLAVVSQDGFLRIFRYDSLELVGITRSYFGGLLCVGWSPDGNYVCVGGEDDLVTVWSFKERRVVARGQGHKSWVAAVAFDPYTTTYGTLEEEGTAEGHHNHHHQRQINECQSSSGVFSCDVGAHTCGGGVSSPANVNASGNGPSSPCAACQINSSQNGGSGVGGGSEGVGVKQRNSLNSSSFVPRSSRTCESMRVSTSDSVTTAARIPACYRLGSVGQDTQLCLWDLTEDVLKHFKQPPKSRPASQAPGELSPHSYSKLYNNSTSQTNRNFNNDNCNSHNSENPRHRTNSDEFNLNVNNECESNSVPSNNGTSAVTAANSSTGTTTATTGTAAATGTNTSNNSTSTNSSGSSHHTGGSSGGGGGGGHSILSLRFGALSFGSDKSGAGKDKEHKRNFSLGSSSKVDKNSTQGNAKGAGLLGFNINLEDPLKLIGTQACPRLDECPLLEPLVCKKISHERLTSLTFREESIVTACQDGIICTWARPGDVVSQL